MSVWFITGISRGLGRALTQAALGRGHTVVGTTRSGTVDLDAPAGRLHVLAFELDDPQGAEEVIGRASALAGGLDVVVNNAGYGLLGPVEEASPDEVRHLFQVNFFGALHVIQAALPYLRKQGHGQLVNVSSIAALDPLAGSGLYAAAKSALSALSESLFEELNAIGIKVTVVEPGSFRTEFLSTDSIRFTKPHIDDYAVTVGPVLDHFADHAGSQAGDPDRAAAVIIDAVESGNPPLHLVLGADALRRCRGRLERLNTDLDEWEIRSAATALVTDSQ